MKPYSVDLRVRIVKAIEEDMSKSGAAHLFGVSLSSVNRYGESLAEGSLSSRVRVAGGRPRLTR